MCDVLRRVGRKAVWCILLPRCIYGVWGRPIVFLCGCACPCTRQLKLRQLKLSQGYFTYCTNRESLNIVYINYQEETHSDITASIIRDFRAARRFDTAAISKLTRGQDRDSSCWRAPAPQRSKSAGEISRRGPRGPPWRTCAGATRVAAAVRGPPPAPPAREGSTPRGFP